MKTKFDSFIASNKSLSFLNLNDVDVLIKDFSSSALQLSNLDLPFKPTPTSQDSSKMDPSLNKEILEENDFSEASILQAFDTWLVSNPSWLEENGFGGAQAQVISASLIFSSFEFSNPGKAKGFDYWYENIFSLPDNAAEIEPTQCDISGYISLTQYQIFITMTDAEGNIAGSTYIINNMDASGSTYSSTIHYDANWNITESPYSVSPGFSRYVENFTLTKSNPDGSIAGFTQITYSLDTSTNNYSSYTNHYDANWNITESAYSDSYGNIRLTQYETITKIDVDGNIAGYTYIIETTDASGNSFLYSHYYDANWNIIKRAYSDNSGFESLEEYETITDVNGNITGYIHITNSSNDTSGYYSSSKIQYDANWNIIESAYSDNSGFESLEEYQTITDANGNITGYICITNSSNDTSGYSSSSKIQYDANWNIIELAYSDNSGFESFEQYETITDVNGNITGYTYISNSIDASGYSSSSKIQYDANWNIIESAYPALNSEQNEMPLIVIYCDFDENYSQWNYSQQSVNNTTFFEYQELRPEDPLYPETLDQVTSEIIGTNNYISEMIEF